MLESEAIEPIRQFWLDTLQADETGQLPLLELPTDYARPLIKTYKGAHLQHTFTEKTLKDLQQLSRQKGATLFMSLTAIVNILLHRYTQQTDILLGTPSAGRNHPDLENRIGFYINTCLLYTSPSPRDRG